MVSILGLVRQALVCLERLGIVFVLGVDSDDLQKLLPDSLFLLFTLDRLEGAPTVIVAVQLSGEIHMTPSQMNYILDVNLIEPLIALG